MSSRDLADLQGISPSFVAKIFPRLEKAGIVRSAEGVRGGYQLASDPADISFLDVVDAVEGPKPLFECREIRSRCQLFDNDPPKWATRGCCGIHAVMLRAEKAMRAELANQSLLDVAEVVRRKAPAIFARQVEEWVGGRIEDRTRRSGVRKSKRKTVNNELAGR